MTVEKIISALNRTNTIVCNLAENPCIENLDNCTEELTLCEEALLSYQTPTPFGNNMGLLLSPIPYFPSFTVGSINTIVDAAGESLTLIGHIKFSSGSGTKTISSAGGKIHFSNGAITTFADAGTTLRIGVQDVTLATGIEDGVFDVSADLVGGIDSLPVSSVITVPMETGTKNITEGDLVAISIEMTSRGGVDSVNLTRKSTTGQLQHQVPYSTIDGGAGPVKSITSPTSFVIEFNDGSFGYMKDLFPYVFNTSTLFNSSSSPDEYALVFTLPVASTLESVEAYVQFATSVAVDIVVYSDPLGTPVVEHSISIPVALTSNGGGGNFGLTNVPIVPGVQLEAGVPYAVSIKPTTTSNTGIGLLSLTNPDIREVTALGTNWYVGTRTDATGAFTPDTTQLPMIALYLNNITSA